MHNTILIIKREYLERVRRKSFIITTILMPLLMIGLMGLPTLVMLLSTPEDKHIAVIDNSGIIASELQNEGELCFTVTDQAIESVEADESYDGVLVIGANILTNTSDLALHTHESISIQTEEAIRRQISGIIEDIRLREYNIENLDHIIAAIKADVSMKTFTIGDEDGRATSSLVSYIMGLVLMMMLYMFIIMYGQMVMTSIIEEKNNRVLEVVVSSVRPFHLMLGKLLGIGAVALTQIAIWAMIIFSFTTWGLPAMSGGIGADTATDIDFMAMMSTLGNPGYIMQLFGWLTLFLIGGYLFYSSLYAAIGSAVDNIQDASQLQSIALVPVIIGLVLSMTVVQDPNSTLGFWGGLIPFTSPMVMMTRLPFGIPVWQMLLSLGILAISVWFNVWLSAKIYRVGIFMHGKKPTFADLIRWTRYK